MRTTFNAVMSNASDALFRAWGSGLSTALATVGMVKVPTAGEVDWATVSTPTAGQTMSGFEVWRFDDAFQASHPIYIKIEYGSGGVAASPALVVTIAKDAGFSQILVPQRRLQNYSAGVVGTTPSVSLVSSCAGRSCIAVVLGVGDVSGSGPRPAFIIDRSRANDGSATPSGIAFTFNVGQTEPSSSAPPNPFVAVAYDSAAAAEGPVPAIIPYLLNGTSPSSSASLATGMIAPVLPWLAFAPGVAPWQPIAGLSYAPGDAVGGAEISVHVLGRDLPYKVVPVSSQHHGWGVCLRPVIGGGTTLSNVRQVGLMILWEED